MSQRSLKLVKYGCLGRGFLQTRFLQELSVRNIFTSERNVVANFRCLDCSSENKYFRRYFSRGLANNNDANNGKGDMLPSSIKGPSLESRESVQSEVAKTDESETDISKLNTPEDIARLEYYTERRKIRKEILKMDAEEYKDTWVLSKGERPTLVDQRSGGPDPPGIGFFSSTLMSFMNTNSRRGTLTFVTQDIDWRPESWRRWYKEKLDEEQIRMQAYNPKRNDVLGNELAAAHFFLYRQCPIKFMGASDWITKYRVDEEEGKTEDDLPYMQFDLCTLPTKYDPKYILEAVDASNFPDLAYEGLENLSNLRHVKYLKLAGCERLDAWCMDRIASYFENSLRYLDISGCVGLTEGALCGLARFRKLETLVVKDMPQVTNKEIVFAMLEDMNPNLKIIGTNYETKLQELIQENEALEKKSREIEETTITVEPLHGPGPDPPGAEENQNTRSINVQMQGGSV